MITKTTRGTLRSRNSPMGNIVAEATCFHAEGFTEKVLRETVTCEKAKSFPHVILSGDDEVIEVEGFQIR